MRKYEKQLHELFCNSPHLTFLFIMRRGVGLTTKSGTSGFLYFTDSQNDLHFDTVTIGIMDEYGNRGEAEEHLLEDLLPRVQMGDHEPIPLYIDGTKNTSKWSRPLTDEDKEYIMKAVISKLHSLEAKRSS